MMLPTFYLAPDTKMKFVLVVTSTKMEEGPQLYAFIKLLVSDKTPSHLHVLFFYLRSEW